eukprot:287758-Prymnesium_polylepis.2
MTSAVTSRRSTAREMKLSIGRSIGSVASMVRAAAGPLRGGSNRRGAARVRQAPIPSPCAREGAGP